MLRTSRNKNRLSHSKKSNKINQSPVIEQESKYEEDFNEIILNDLVPDCKKEEFRLDDTQRSKKVNGLKINLGLGSKKTISKSKHKSNYNKDISDIKIKNNKTNTDNTVKHTNQEILKCDSTLNKEKSISHKKQNKKEILKNSNLNKKESKKLKNKRKKIYFQNEIKKDELRYDEIKSKENIKIPNEIDYNEQINKNTVFRCEEKIKDEINNENLNHKFENLVWSEDKFPKK